MLKPAPDTPWVPRELGRLAAEHTDLPPGVFNVVTSPHRSAGEQLTTDPRVDLVSFTGSTATGRAVMAAAAPTLKRVFLELGGKSAALVLDDGDLGAGAGMAAFSVCIHAGQGCALTTRLIVPRARYDEAVEIAANTMRYVQVGDPTDPATVCGPLISAAQRSRVEGYLALARDEGGRFARRRHHGRPATVSSAVTGRRRRSSPGWTTALALRARRSSGPYSSCWHTTGTTTPCESRTTRRTDCPVR